VLHIAGEALRVWSALGCTARFPLLGDIVPLRSRGQYPSSRLFYAKSATSGAYGGASSGAVSVSVRSTLRAMEGGAACSYPWLVVLRASRGSHIGLFFFFCMVFASNNPNWVMAIVRLWSIGRFKILFPTIVSFFC